MRVKVAKWGNSLAVRLPRKLAERIDLREGQELDIDVAASGALRIAPAGHRRSPTIEELFAEAERNGPLEPPGLVDWGPDRGAEILPEDEYSRGEITYEDIVSGRDAARRR